MAREASRLSTMDERLLLLTRLDHEAPAFAPFDSQAMAREALSVFDGVRLEGDDAVFVGERELTILLLRNLVVNAQRAGGKEAVRVTLHPDGFDVTDYGCGMTKEQIARRLSRFIRPIRREPGARAARGWDCRSAAKSRGCIMGNSTWKAKSAEARAFVTGLIHLCDDTETHNRVA